MAWEIIKQSDKVNEDESALKILDCWFFIISYFNINWLSTILVNKVFLKPKNKKLKLILIILNNIVYR